MVSSSQAASMSSEAKNTGFLVQRANWFAVMESMTTETLTHMLAAKQRSPMKLFKESMVNVMQLQPEQIRALLETRQQIQQELAAIAVERREVASMLSKVCIPGPKLHPV